MAQRKSRQREPAPDPVDTKARASRAAQAMHEQHDPTETTQAARTTFMRRFERMVDPAMTMLPATRELLAEQRKHEYFHELAMLRWHGPKSSKAEQKKTATRQPIV